MCRVRGAPPLFLNGWCMGRAVCAAALGCLSCASGGFCLSVRVVGSWGGREDTHSHDDTTGPEGGDCMLVDGGSGIGSNLIWLADLPTVASPPSNG